MKKISKLKLNSISEKELSNRQMKEIKGGGNVCFCACYYVNHGGSSTTDNCNANYRINIPSPQGGTQCIQNDSSTVYF